MKLTKGLILATAAIIFSLHINGGAIAVDEEYLRPTPLSDYCDRVSERIGQACANRFEWDDLITVVVAVDTTGRIVNFDRKNGPKSLKALEIVRSITSLPPPPSIAKQPLWLKIGTSRQKGKITTILRDVDFDGYMSAIQKQIKSKWHPLKGRESNKTKVTFTVLRNGRMQDLKVLESGGIEGCDTAALAAVTAAQPFPQLPDGSPTSVNIEFAFDYHNWGREAQATHIREQTYTPSAEAALANKYGLTALEGRNYLLASQYLEKAVKLSPEEESYKKNLSAAFKGLAISEFRTNPDQAMQYFKKAKEACPTADDLPETLEKAQEQYGKGGSQKP